MNQNNFNVQTNKDLPNRKESNGEGSSQVTDHIVKEIESYVALNPNNTDFRCSLSLSLFPFTVVVSFFHSCFF